MLANIIIAGLSLFALSISAFGWRLGKIPGPGGYPTVSRETSPQWFWLYLGSYCAVGVALAAAFSARLLSAL